MNCWRICREVMDHLFPGQAPRQLIAIPTTAGTGSEVTPWATVWDQARGSKLSLHLPWTWPAGGHRRSDLMLSLPPATLASGLDALSHALESLWNVHRNPVSASLAVSAARSIVATLPDLLAQPREPAARAPGHGRAAGRPGVLEHATALAHSLSYDITLRHGTPHGIACSFSLPQSCGWRLRATTPPLDALLLVGLRRRHRRRPSLRCRRSSTAWASASIRRTTALPRRLERLASSRRWQGPRGATSSPP
jgi:alcohol dehydrogenase class IV